MLFLAAIPEPGLAQPGDGKTKLDDVVHLGKIAQAQFTSERYDAALKTYLALEGLLESEGRPLLERAAARCSIARCQEELGHHIDALESYDRCVVPELPAQMRDGYANRRALLEKQWVGGIATACKEPKASVQITRAESQSEGPTQACEQPWPRLRPGVYRIVATSAEGIEIKTEAVVVAGEVERVDLVFQPKPKAPPPDLPPEKAVSDVEEVAPPPPTNTLAWGLTGGAGAAIAGSALLFVLAGQDISDGDAAYDRYDTATNRDEAAKHLRAFEDADDAAATKATVGYVLLGIGLAAGGAATWAWLRDPADGSTSTTAVTKSEVSVGVAPGGVCVGWRW